MTTLSKLLLCPTMTQRRLAICFRRLASVLTLHPVIWAIAGCLLFWAWGGLMSSVSWNAIEIMMGRNLLRGYGLVVAPLDPPALWRPLLGALICALIERFVTDPFIVYRVIYSISLSVFLVATFYAARELWGRTAGHVACVFVLTSGALTAMLIGHVDSISHVVFLLVAGPALWATALALRNPTALRLVAAGVCWGLTSLARWETLPYFVVTSGVLVYATYSRIKTMAVSGPL